MGAADLSASLHQNSTEITVNRNENYIGETQRILIEEAQPARRIEASVDVRLAAGIGARLSVNHIGAVTTPFIFEEPTTIEAAAIADMEVTFQVGDRILVGLGANNLLDKLPQPACGRGRGTALVDGLPRRVSVRGGGSDLAHAGHLVGN